MSRRTFTHSQTRHTIFLHRDIGGGRVAAFGKLQGRGCERPLERPGGPRPAHDICTGPRPITFGQIQQSKGGFQRLRCSRAQGSPLRPAVKRRPSSHCKWRC